MSGIFKGDSIYKSGGGGSGYKDGGELVDGDFIKVENNTISTYDNISRGTVNFYFEPKDGEILNSVIEMTTQVNATVNVYYINDLGLYVNIGNIGGNTVSSGNSYNINVNINSFSIQLVDNSNESESLLFEDNLYKTKSYNISGVKWIWTTEDIINKQHNNIYWYMSEARAAVFPNGFGLPTNDDCITFFNYVRNNISGWALNIKNPSSIWSPPGTGESGFSFNAVGVMVNNTYYQYPAGSQQGFWLKYQTGVYANTCRIPNDNGDPTYSNMGPDYRYCVRLLKKVQ